jgi:hypothetical protein
VSLADWFRRLFPSPTESAEDAAALEEDFGAPDEGKADEEWLEYRSGGGPVPGLATSDAADVAEAELDELEPPPDPDP